MKFYTNIVKSVIQFLSNLSHCGSKKINDIYTVQPKYEKFDYFKILSLLAPYFVHSSSNLNIIMTHLFNGKLCQLFIFLKKVCLLLTILLF